MKVQEVQKIHKVQKNHQERTKTPYDIVITYCSYCQEKLEVHVYHPRAKLEYFQLINLPERIADHLQRREFNCNNCNKTFVLEKNIHNTKTEFLTNSKPF